MTDIFTLINQLPDDDIRLQLAFFDSVTLTSAAKETGSRLLSGMADVANSFAQMFTDKLKVGYDYKKVSDMVDSRITELKAVKREQLLMMLDIKLMELVSLSQQIDISTQDGREKLSILVVDTAGSGYTVNQYMAPAHKMRIIADKYNDTFMDNLMQSLKNMTPDQLKEWSPIMDKAIGMADIETKRIVHKELMPAVFNGMGVLKCLRKQKTPMQLKLVIDCFGIEAFDYKTIEIKTMYQALRHFNRISVFQLARLISVAVKKYNRPLYAADELMPSYVADSDRAKADDEEKEYQALAKQVSGLDEKKARCERELEAKEAVRGSQKACRCCI